MNNFESKEIRRFFDLLGSVFCGLLYSCLFWRENFRFSSANAEKYYFLPVFMLSGLIIYLGYHKFIWKFVNTKFLFGYANFILISILGLMSFVLIGGAWGAILSSKSNFTLRELSFKDAYELVFFFYLPTLPMAFFWLLGILCSWRFSSRKALP